MQTPVLIPARNEAAVIGRTLESLPRDCDPIVIANGCTDNTAQIADSYGVTVIEREEPGKLPALQHALMALGSRAIQPLIMLDADAYPLYPNQWVQSLLDGRKQLPASRPAIVTGTLSFNGLNPVESLIKTVGHYRYQYQTRHNGMSGCFGINVLADFHNQQMLNSVLELPHIWPGEDTAIKDQIVLAGGNVLKLLNLGSSARTSGERYGGYLRRLINYGAVLQGIADSYEQDCPNGARSYEAFLRDGTLAKPIDTQ